MKTLMLALAVTSSLSAFATDFDSMVDTRIYNRGHEFQIVVNNFLGRPVSCEGEVYLKTSSGETLTELFYDVIPRKHETVYHYRYIYKIESVSHTIVCR